MHVHPHANVQGNHRWNEDQHMDVPRPVWKTDDTITDDFAGNFFNTVRILLDTRCQQICSNAHRNWRITSAFLCAWHSMVDACEGAPESKAPRSEPDRQHTPRAWH